MSIRTTCFSLSVILLSSAQFAFAQQDSKATEAPARYETRTASRDGIGKFYMGREIAHVVGGEHSNNWLERDSRQSEERPDIVLESFGLKPGMKVADIGAGTGYYSWRMAKEVGKNGTVYAVELEQEQLDIIAANMKQRGVENVKGVIGTIMDPKLPEGALDLVVMIDVYHEFSHPYEMMQAVAKSLKPSGRVAWVEFRMEDESVPIKRLHKMSEAQVKKEASALPLEWVETVKKAPWQHVIIFKKRAEK